MTYIYAYLSLGKEQLMDIADDGEFHQPSYNTRAGRPLTAAAAGLLTACSPAQLSNYISGYREPLLA